MNQIDDYIEKTKPELLEVQNANIPVFLHIPKCAGTYTLQLLIQLLYIYSNLKFKITAPKKHAVVYQIYENDLLFLRVLALDAKKDIRPGEDTELFKNLDFNSFLKLCHSGDLDIFCMVVTSQALRIKNKDFLSIISLVEEKSFIFFTNVRSVFSRCLSLYYVHKKNKRELSSLYLPHDEYSVEEFSKFLNSGDSSPNWISYFFSSIFNMNTREVFEFVKKYMGVAHITDTVPQLADILKPIHGQGLTNFLKYLPQTEINPGRYTKVYTPADISMVALEGFKKLHSGDLALVQAMLPDLKYDETGTCESTLIKSVN